MKKLVSTVPVLVALVFAVLIPLTSAAEDTQATASPVSSDATAVVGSEACLGAGEWTFGEEIVFDTRAAGPESASACEQNCNSEYSKCLDDCSLTDWLCQSRCDNRLRRCLSRCPV